MTNYTSTTRCACIGEEVGRTQPMVMGRVYVAALNPEEHLGPGTSFEQRRAFEWGYLGAVSRRNGEDAHAELAAANIKRIREECGY